MYLFHNNAKGNYGKSEKKGKLKIALVCYNLRNQSFDILGDGAFSFIIVYIFQSKIFFFKFSEIIFFQYS